MSYYQGGYYLLKLKKADFGSLKGRKLWTASACINTTYLDAWAFGWVGEKEDIKKKYAWSNQEMKALEIWTDAQFEAGQVGWVDVFHTLEAAQEYKDLFFKEEELLCLGLSFSKQQKQALIERCAPQEALEGEIGLRKFLRQETPENPTGKWIGYDLIGVEIDGSFHSLHCHDLQSALEEKFELTFNQYGLIDSCEEWEAVLKYCNAEKTGLEPVPWFWAKVKLYE